MREQDKKRIKQLRAAYPAGYLLSPGVQTVGGWACVQVGDALHFHRPVFGGFYGDPQEVRCSTHGACLGPSEYPKFGQASDGLLPHIDPSQVATWACALVDLTFFARGSVREDRPWETQTGTLVPPDNYGERWFLQHPSGASTDLPVLYGDSDWLRDVQADGHYPEWPTATQDVVEALLEARRALVESRAALR